MFPETINSPEVTWPPQGITPMIERIVRKELFTGHLWWRHQRDLPQAVVAAMSKELEKIDKDNVVSKLPGGGIDPFFYGYMALILEIEYALKHQDPKYRLTYVRMTFGVSEILNEDLGDSSLGGMRDESFTREQRDLESLGADPSGISLAREKVEQIGKGDDPSANRKRAGSLVALQRYQDVFQLAQQLASH